MWARFSWRYSVGARSEMSESVFLSVGDGMKRTWWVCWDTLRVSSRAPGFAFCLWSQSLRRDPAVPTPTGFSAPFLFFFLFLFSCTVTCMHARGDAGRCCKSPDGLILGERVRGEPSPSASWTGCHPESPRQPETFQLFFRL